jgi:hypothetical protein
MSKGEKTMPEDPQSKPTLDEVLTHVESGLSEAMKHIRTIIDELAKPENKAHWDEVREHIVKAYKSVTDELKRTHGSGSGTSN